VAEGRQHHNLTLAILTIAGTAYALQQTLVVPALPTLQHDLHTTTTWVTWVLTVFLLVSSVATPILGKLGDQYGKERLLVIALAVFLVGSAGSIFAWNVWSLIGARALAGAGGAVFPLSFAIVRDEFPREKMSVAIGVISAMFGVGGGLGIVFSGVIVDHASWRWLFVAGAIPIALAIVLVHRFVPESPIKTASKVDVVGAMLLSLGLVALLLALTEGETWGWGSARILGLFATSALALAAWVAAELRVAQPLVDMHVFVRREVLFTNVTTLIAGFAMFGTFVLLPNFVETPRGLGSLARLVHYGFGASATKAGLYLLPTSATMLFAAPLAGVIARRTGSRWTLSAGLVLVALSCGSLALWHARPWEILAAMPSFGVGAGFAFAAMATLITESVRPTETGIATGMNTVMRTVGGVIGGQVGAALLSAYLIGGTHVPAATGFQIAFATCAVAALVGAATAALVTPPRAVRRGRLAPAAAESGDG
jgi:EmrB/QacA subfamily drug resistance transporter